MNFTISSHSLSCGTLIFPIAQTDDFEKTLEQLGVGHLAGQFKGNAKEVLVMRTNRGGWLYYLGLGKNPAFAETLAAFRSLSFRYRHVFTPDTEIAGMNLLTPRMIEAAINGLALGFYDISLYKTEPKKENAVTLHNLSINICISPEQKSGEFLEYATKGFNMADTQRRIMDLVNAPANYKTPETLALWAMESGEAFGFKTTVWNKAACEANGLGALLSIGQGSEVEPRFIIMDYAPANATKTIGLVGKGVTFDTGGVSIKDSANMHFMKSDMGGAAAVLGAIEAASRAKLPVRVVGIIPATENCVGSKSVKPGDVITSYLGKTIEIIDTDAEGRVILADGLGYMVRNFTTDVLIDVATLTGSCVQTLGNVAGGLFSNNDALATKLANLGEASGERVWRLPLWDAYAGDIKSDIADLKNYHNKPTMGAIVAAKFLEVFTEKHPAWAHLDMAAMAFADSEFSSMRAATAWGVRLLTDFCASSDTI